MEVDIPDLQDLRFVNRCSWCAGTGRDSNVNPRRPAKPCPICHGDKGYLTDVGVRLIEFLESLGVEINNPEGWKE